MNGAKAANGAPRTCCQTFGTKIMITFEFRPALDLTVGVVVAIVLATLIGAERQYRQRSAGLRTNVLVAVGAATFVSLGFRMNGSAGASQIAAYVVSGIGFFGAGAIMKEGSKVWGQNTAATLWCSAAIGALAGYGLAVEAIVVTAAVLAGNTLLRPLVDAINRAPFDERTSETTYEVHVMTDAKHVGEVGDRVIEALEGPAARSGTSKSSNFPTRSPRSSRSSPPTPSRRRPA